MYARAKKKECPPALPSPTRGHPSICKKLYVHRLTRERLPTVGDEQSGQRIGAAGQIALDRAEFIAGGSLALEKTGAAGALARAIVIHLQWAGTNLILCALLR
jgi:hypothetical protein